METCSPSDGEFLQKAMFSPSVGLSMGLELHVTVKTATNAGYRASSKPIESDRQTETNQTAK